MKAQTKAKDEVCFLDSGCSNHMVGTKDWLFDFDDNFRASVKMGNDSKMQVMGKREFEVVHWRYCSSYN